MTRTVQCVKLGREAEGLDKPPFPGPAGQRIFEQVSKEGWHLWMEHQTRVINEYRLALSEPDARKFLSAEREKFFFGGGDLTQTSHVPLHKKAE